MLCRKCNYILTGKENFCPNCGTMPLDAAPPYPTVKKLDSPPKSEGEKTATEQKKVSDSLFSEDNQSFTAPSNMKIFNIDNDDEEHEELSPKMKKDENKRGAVGKIFLLLFICCVLAVTAFGLADYFGITPRISRLVNGLVSDGSANQESTVGAFSHDSTVVEPEINYRMKTAYVFSGKGLSLRKGPSNSFAPLHNLTDLTQVKIFGASIANPNWVYVYCPEKECYGWLDGGFLCGEELAQERLARESTSAEDIPTNYYSEY